MARRREGLRWNDRRTTRCRYLHAGIIIASLAATPVSAQQAEQAPPTAEPTESCGLAPTMRTENWLDDWALFVAVVVAPPFMLTFLEDCDERAHLNVTRGGVFLGYSDVGDGPERWKMSGWELGFPITASVKGEGSPLWIRAEPRYLLTPDGPNVMMDIGLWADLPNAPVMMGVTGTMTRREPDPFVVGLTIGRRIGPAD